MTVGHKRRRWQAVLSVSASGPEFSPILEQNGRLFRPRMAADLRYTTADVDYLESRFREGDYDSGEYEEHWRLRNPSRAQFLTALHELGEWLAAFQNASEWDGGGILFCFAGHGREGDGAIILEDNAITPDDLMRRLADIADRVSPPGGFAFPQC